MAQNDDLETSLGADPDGSALRAAKERLAAMKSELRAQCDQGLPPERFATADALLGGVDAAEDFLEWYWKRKN